MEYTADQKVFVYTAGSYGRFALGTVVKVTKNFVDVQLGTATPTRFNGTTGQEVGTSSSYFRRSLDRAPFAEREAQLAQEKRANFAANAVALVTPQSGINARWGKDSLLKEVARLEAALAAARQAVEAI